jgi:two-component system, cell cycle sensor histidine kinase and response regulator CckA
MNLLDVRTVLLCSLLMTTVCTVAIGHMCLQHRAEAKGLGWWLADFVLYWLGVCVIALRGIIAVNVSILLGTPLIVGATILLYEGLLRYTGRRASQRANVAMLVAVIVLQAWFTLHHPSLLARNVILSVGLGFVCAQCAWLAFRASAPDQRSSLRFIGIVFAAFCLVSAIRVPMELSRPPGDDLFTSGPYVAGVLLVYQALFLGLAFGLLVLVSRRLQGSLLADVQARMKTEVALRQSEEKFALAFHHAPYAITISRESDGKLVEVNDAFCRMSGSTRDQAVGSTTRELGLLADTQESDRLLESLRAGERLSGREVCFKRKNGEVMWAKVSAGRLSIHDAPMMLASIDDITEQRHLEEQLRAAQKMEAIGRLAGGVAHDFNNMLSVILSNTAFAIDAVQPKDPVREDLEEVRMAAERATVLTRQLLAFSRKQVLDPEVLDLSEVAAGLKSLLGRLLGENIELVLDLAPDLANVKADRGQIEQLIMNLVVNARDAMPGGGKVTLQTSGSKRDQGAQVRLAVVDTGCGMDPATRERIFEPFFTTKARGKGTGLGLSTVYGIVTQSGGSIEVDSEPGKGTTFTIYLPVTTEEVMPPALSLPPARGRKETILVVEDEEAVRKVAARILRNEGYRVLCASHGQEALATCEQHTGEIHLLLTDVVMPEMNGRQLAEHLQRTRAGMRVLYMSGYPDDAIAHHGVLEAGTKFIGKPFHSRDLLRKVREALDCSV